MSKTLKIASEINLTSSDLEKIRIKINNIDEENLRQMAEIESNGKNFDENSIRDRFDNFFNQIDKPHHASCGYLQVFGDTVCQFENGLILDYYFQS